MLPPKKTLIKINSITPAKNITEAQSSNNTIQYMARGGIIKTNNIGPGFGKKITKQYKDAEGKDKVDYEDGTSDFVDSDSYREKYNTGLLYGEDSQGNIYTQVDKAHSEINRYKELTEKESFKDNMENSYFSGVSGKVAKANGETSSNLSTLDPSYKEAYDKRINNKYVEDYISRNPKNENEDRGIWLDRITKDLPESLKTYINSNLPKADQTSGWQEAKRGLISVVNSSTGGTSNDYLKLLKKDKDLSSFEKDNIKKNFNNNSYSTTVNQNLGLLAPASIPGKVIQSMYRPEYTLLDAVKGRKNNAGVLEDIGTDIIAGEAAIRGVTGATKAVGTGIKNLSDIKYVNKATGQPNLPLSTLLSTSKTSKGIKNTMDAENTFVRGFSTNFDAPQLDQVKRVLKRNGIDYKTNPEKAAEFMATSVPESTGFGRAGLLESESGIYTSNSIGTAKGYTYGDGYIATVKRPTDYSSLNRKDWVDKNKFITHKPYTNTTFKGHNPVMQDAYNPGSIIDTSSMNIINKTSFKVKQLKAELDTSLKARKLRKANDKLRNDPLYLKYKDKELEDFEKALRSKPNTSSTNGIDLKKITYVNSEGTELLKNQIITKYGKKALQEVNTIGSRIRRLTNDAKHNFIIKNKNNINPKVYNPYSHYIIKGEPNTKALDLVKLERYKEGKPNDFTRAHNGEYTPGLSTAHNPEKTFDFNAIKESIQKTSKLQQVLRKLTNKNKIKTYAMGGTIRPSSRNRHIAPMIIAAGVQAGIGLVGSFLGMSAADKARREQLKQIAQQNTDRQQLQLAEQKRSDFDVYNKTNLEGDSTVQYYAEGGELNPLASTQQPMVGRAINNTSLAGYATKGGNLVQIGDGVEEARGNKHNETKIDGVSGIQLHPEGAPEPIAEIEDKEILVDGNKVLSQQLKYKGNQSYADKMRQIVKNRNKLEKEQLETKSTRKKNTVERKLAGLNMAEETLFKVQEAHKELEGTQVLDKLKSFAMGGIIQDPPKKNKVMTKEEKDAYLAKSKNLIDKVTKEQKKKEFNNNINTYEDYLNNEIKKKSIKKFAMGGTIGEPIISEGKYKGWTKTAKGFYRHPSNKNVIVDENGNPKYNYELEKEANMFGVKNVTPNQTPIPVNTPTLPTPSTNSVPAPIIVPPPSAAAMPGQIAPPASTTNQPSKLEGFLSSSTGQGIIGALPGIASGIGAYIMAGNTPSLPKPLLNRAETLETRVNVNPQLANIRGTVKASVDNILQNTSSSNNAKQNIASVRLKGAAEVNNVLNNKENTETQLKNADSQNRQMVANANTATLNQDGMNQYQRLNDIRTMKSAGFAHITGAIQNGINIKRTADNFDAYTKANLADDKLGEKVGLYMNDRNFMANPSNRETVISILNTKTSDGEYKYPFDRANAIKKGIITE